MIGDGEEWQTRDVELDGVKLTLVLPHIVETDRYGRSIAEVWNGYGLIQSQLTAGGFVYPYEQYKSDCPNWDAVKYSEDWAKKNKLGVWGNPNTVKPWDYRKK